MIIILFKTHWKKEEIEGSNESGKMFIWTWAIQKEEQQKQKIIIKKNAKTNNEWKHVMNGQPTEKPSQAPTAANKNAKDKPQP